MIYGWNWLKNQNFDLHSKLSRDSSGKKSSIHCGFTSDACWTSTRNSFVMASESLKNCRMWLGELSPFWNSDRKRHHSLPLLFVLERRNGRSSSHTSNIRLCIVRIRVTLTLTLVINHRFYTNAADLYDISLRPSDFSAADTYLDRHYSAPSKYHSDRTATQGRRRAECVPLQFHRICCTCQSQTCAPRQNYKFLWME